MKKATDGRISGVNEKGTHEILKQVYDLARHFLLKLRFSNEGLDEAERDELLEIDTPNKQKIIVERILANPNDCFILLYNNGIENILIGIFYQNKIYSEEFVENWMYSAPAKFLRRSLDSFNAAGLYLLQFHAQYILKEDIFTERKDRKAGAINQERDSNLLELKKDLVKELKKIEDMVAGTSLEHDNFLAVADNILQKSKNENEIYNNVQKYFNTLHEILDIENMNSSRKSDMLYRLYGLAGALARVKYRSKLVLTQEISEATARFNTSQKSGFHDYYSLDFESVKWKYMDAAGYTIDLSKYLKQKIKKYPLDSERLQSRIERTVELYESFLLQAEKYIQKMVSEKLFHSLADFSKELSNLSNVIENAERDVQQYSTTKNPGEKQTIYVLDSWHTVSNLILELKQEILKK